MTIFNSLFNLEDKVVVLTGGGGILAGEMAKGFSDAGTKVVLLDINEENLLRKVDNLNKDGREVIGFQSDVLDEANLRSVHKKILNEFGRIDVLVNAAGGNMAGATIGID